MFFVNLLSMLYANYYSPDWMTVPDAQARMALADPIRQFSAYEWIQPNSYKMTCFASAHAVCISLVQATKQELR
jgi:hypothetical protein